jgi:alanine racemase
MGILYKEDIPWAIENGIEFYVFNLDRLILVHKIAQTLSMKAIVHQSSTGRIDQYEPFYG